MAQAYTERIMRKPISFKSQPGADLQSLQGDFIACGNVLHNGKKWKICVEHPFINCERIYPFQQKKVAGIVDALKGDAGVRRIIIFGSSVTDRCHVGSDVDVFVEMDSENKLSLPAFDFAYDMWTNYTVDSSMMREIREKGVVVYERDIVG